jgi:hypothetical protein
MEIIKGKTLAVLAAKASEACKKKAIPNLVLHGTFPVEEAESPFIKSYDELALKWQAIDKADELFFTHGQYINRSGDGRAFLLRELTRKKDSNRAVFSLIDMQDLINSGDNPIPSFMILQCSFSEEGYKKLFVTAYFRALEVSQFLPINLAEIGQVIRYLKASFLEMSEFELTIVAFIGHFLPHFNCLSKTLLDSVTEVEIALAVDRQDKNKLREWLDSKLNVEETVIFTHGLEVMYQALEACKDKYEKHLRTDIKRALAEMKRLKEIRQKTSHSSEITKLSQSIKKNLQDARSKLGED